MGFSTINVLLQSSVSVLNNKLMMSFIIQSLIHVLFVSGKIFHNSIVWLILLVCILDPLLTFNHIVLVIFRHDAELVQVDSGEGVHDVRAGVRVYVVSCERGGWATIRGPWLHETHQCPAWADENKQILWIYNPSTEAP